MDGFGGLQWLGRVDWGLHVWKRSQGYEWEGRVPGQWALVTERVPCPVQGHRIRGPLVPSDVVEEGQ